MSAGNSDGGRTDPDLRAGNTGEGALTSLLIRGGELVDPVNGLHSLSDLIFEDGRVAAVGPELATPRGAQVVDARGLLVMPGLVDTHVHVAAGYWQGHAMMARAGVTTALNLSGRMADVMEGVRAAGAGLTIASLDSLAPGDPLPTRSPAAPDISRAIEEATAAGAVGVKILGGHLPFEPDASAAIIRAANEQGAYVAFHVGTTEHGSDLAGLRQAAELADERALHVAHVNSYCRGLILDPIEEAQEAVQILTRWPRLRSESYLARINGTSGRCIGGVPESNVTKNCLRMGGYEPAEAGLEAAIGDGYALVGDGRGDEVALLRGEEARELWRELGTAVGISFPINDPTSQFILATARHADGRFVVDALSTDGGGIPRNVTIERGLAVVTLGGLTLPDLVRKACLAPARMLGLHRKGHLSVGADADAVLVDRDRGRARMTIAAGRPIMIDGVVVGSGGTVATTARGERAVRAFGLPVEVIDLQTSALYSPEVLAP